MKGIKKAKAGAIILIFTALLMPSCMSAEQYFGKTAPPKEQVLLYWNGSEPQSLDPHKVQGTVEQNILLNLFESLTSYDPKTLDPKPGVAESWEALDGARKWVFHLRKNAVWTDGLPVTAHDFVWAWRRAAAPETASLYANLMYYVRNGEAISNGQKPPETLGVRAVDDYTLEVEMERPTAFFTKMTSHYVFAPLPSRAIEKWGDKWIELGKFISNGPFSLVEHKPYDRITIVKSANYWDAANVKLEKVVFLPVEDTSTGINLYKAGDVYTMQSGSLPLPFLKGLKKKKDYVGGILFATYFYSFNIAKKPLDDARVRRALNMAVDKQSITDQLVGKGDQPATSLVPPGISGYPPPGIETAGPSYGPDEARRLLAEAGFPDGKGFPKLTIYHHSQEAHRQIAEAIQQMWKKVLNIEVDLQNEEFRTYLARLGRKDFDICQEVWSGDYLDPNSFLDLYLNGYHSGWVNEEYKRLINAANAEPDQARRMEMLAQAEKIMVDEMPITPIYHLALSYMAKPFVEGWHPNLLDIHPLKYVSIKQDWTAQENLAEERH